MEIVKPKGVITKEEYNKLSTEEKLTYWKTAKEEYILMSEMSDEHLQKAKYYAQTKELVFHNNYMLFCGLDDALSDEAEKRNLELKDIDTDFHKKKKHWNKKKAAKVE